MYKNQEIGKLGEELASKYLQDLGYEILCRNFSCRQGEIDIIAYKKKEIIFIEVKTRTNLRFGRPSEAVTNVKQTHIKKAAEYYIYRNHLEYKYIRFDIIEIYIFDEKYKINHIKQVM